ncbi:MAG: ROK family protein [Balneolaceae bacterium]
MKHCTIGIDLGATNIRVARIEDGKIKRSESHPIAKSQVPDDLIEQIKNLIKLVISESVQSIGIGVPSVVDVEKGIVYDVQNIPAWKKVPLKNILEDKFNISVYINNDANCYVLGEKYYGKGKGYNSIVGLILGTGFGSGLVINGKLVSGENCGAGEVGMLPYKDSIFEHYCSGQFFEIHKNIAGDKAYKQAREGDQNSIEMYKEYGTHLGNAIKAVMYAYDPALIILGGSIKSAYDLFEEEMHSAMQDFAYPKSLQKLKITCSELDQVAVLGAVALSLDQEMISTPKA